MSDFPGARKFLGHTWPTRLSKSDRSAAKRFKVPLVGPEGRPRSNKVVLREIKKAERKRNNLRQVNDNKMERLVNQMKRGDKDLSDLHAFLRNFEDPAERKRLRARVRKNHPDLVKPSY